MLAALLTAASALSTFPIAEVVAIYDGDTFFVNLPSVEPSVFSERMPVRIRGIDAPEKVADRICEKRDAEKSVEILRSMLIDGYVRLVDCGRDKYFRLLCDIKIHESDIKDLMLRSGYAIAYDGGEKVKWKCKRTQ